MTVPTAVRRLTHDALPHPEAVPPVRIVHVGLGAFHRSHQAWFTAHAADSAEWGIAAFTGRRPEAAMKLEEQGCVYTLVERGPVEDTFELIGSIVSAAPGDDIAAFVGALASPQVAVLSLTITEAGYRLRPDGPLDLDDPEVAADVLLLSRLFAGVAAGEVPAPATALGRVLLGLEARRLTGAPPIAIVPCDNLPDNGRLVGDALAALAAQTSPALAAWLPAGTAAVSTSVDRITPRLEPEDRQLVATATGWFDETPVIAEPFADWVLSGDFPSGRPHWESAGARFVDEIRPWENRKLWMLNGAHTVLAASGRLRGHETVAEAIQDPACRAEVERLWDDAVRQLTSVETDDYRLALIERFANPRIVHRLAQIAEGSTTKVRVRIVPVALAERAAGRGAEGCATAIAAWILSEHGDSGEQATRERLRELSAELAADLPFADRVVRELQTLTTESPEKKAEPIR